MSTQLKKVLLGSMLVLVVLVMGVYLNSGAKPAVKWDGKTVTEIKAKNDVFVIKNASDLAWVASTEALNSNDHFANKTVRFANDIDMDNKTFIGIELFKGRLEGNHKMIHNLIIDNSSKNYIGLISILDNGSIDNLTIASGLVNGGRGFGGAGGFIGIIPKGSKSTLIGVINHATVTGEGSTGGIVGRSDGALTIDSSSNNGSIIGKGMFGSSNIGGLIGFSYRASAIIINNSSNKGDVKGTRDIGGFIGLSRSSTVTIENSSNIGTVEGRSQVGGLVGVNTDESTLTITNSSNMGAIAGSVRDSGPIGGLVGGNVDESTLIIANSSNIGVVKADINVGGFVGSSSSSTLIIDNSSNIANVDGTGTGSDEYYIGGLIGYIWGGTLTITNSSSIGGLSAQEYDGVFRLSYRGMLSDTAKERWIGGIIGEVMGDVTLTNVYSYAESVTVGDDGGIAGEVSHGTVTANNVYWLYDANNVGIKDAVGTISRGIGKVTNRGSNKLTISEFTDNTKFKGWDFEKVWEMKEGGKYPTLRNLIIPEKPVVVTP